MKRFLLAAHGKMAGGIKSSVDILLGNSDCLSVIDAYVDEANPETAVSAFFDSVSPDDQIVMMSDVYGGSVNQIMFRYLGRPNTFLISGVNLPLVLELIIDSEMEFTADTLNLKISEARENLRLVVTETEAEEDDNFF